jgi:hypothetical protein
MGNPWDNDPIVGAVTPGPVYGSVNPYKAHDQANQDAMRGFAANRDARDAATTPLDIESKRTTISNSKFDNMNGLRKQFEAEAPVATYRTILPMLASAYRAGPGGAGDLDIVYAVGKVMDPGSVVREGELQMANTTGSAGQQLAGYYKQITEGGKLTEEVRKGLLNELRVRGAAIADAYNQRRAFYKDLSSRHGINPEDIVGPHPGAPFQQAEADFIGRPIHNLDGSQGAAPAGYSAPSDPNAPPVGSIDPKTGALELGDIRLAQREADPAAVAARTKDVGGFGAGLAGAVDSITFGTGDEIAAGIDAFGGSLAGKGSIGSLYAQNVANERAIREKISAEHPGSFLTGQIVGGVALPVGVGARGIAGMARVGAAQGAAYGFGSGEGNALERLPGALAGGAVGGAVGAGLGAAAPYAANALSRFAPATARDAEVAAATPIIEAGQRQGIPIRQPDARPGLRGQMAAVEKSPSAAPRVGEALRSDRDLMAWQVSNLSPNGAARDPYALGNITQEAVNRHGARTKGEADALYARARTAAPGHKAEPLATIGTIDQRIAELAANGETANAAEIKVLEGVKADLSKSGLSVDSLQAQRRGMRQRLKDNGIDFGSADASYMDVLNIAGQELESSLKDNPRALGALKTANAQWAQRASFRKDVARQFIGTPNAPVAPEMAAQRFLSMTKKGGDYNRFSRMFAELEPGEKADLGATIADGLGKTKAGEFAYGKFVSDVQGMGKRAIRDLYGEDGEKAINDLKVIASAKSGTAGKLNHSNTGDVVSRNNGFKNAILSVFGGSVAGLPGAIAGAASRGLLERFTSGRAARMLLNPDFTGWLKRTPLSSDPQVIDRHFARLTSIASKDAVFAADVKSLQGLLTQAFTESPGRLAASDKESDGRRKPPQ